jgi:hypothetical protein
VVGKSLQGLGFRNLIDFGLAESKRCTRLKNRPHKRRNKTKNNNKLKIKKGNKL